MDSSMPSTCFLHLDSHASVGHNNNNNLQAFQLIVLARYLLGVPNPSPVSHDGSCMHIML